MTPNQKPYIVLPHNDFVDKETVNDLKSIAAIIGIIPAGADLIL